ncbi:7-methylguanosine phosphate-specific 5'-nucleotidase [Entomophthora muscae]|nr:7-methylguanosine phosphate-specific 5'-nucleotidase [Entomophthora muscae]
MTLTKRWSDGKRNLISHGVLPAFEETSKEFIDELKKLITEIHQIENDISLSIEDKACQLHSIWEKSNACHVNEKFTFEFICKAVDAHKINYREGVHQLIATTGANQIPVLIFSAGIGDIILESLKIQDLLLPHMHIMANFMIFEESSPFVLVGFKEPLIHCLNKGDIDIKDTSFYSSFTSRKNIILLGDTLGDLAMAAKQDYDTLLTVGFLNEEVEANIEKFSSHFDVVITNDSSFDWVNKIIKSIIHVNCAF